MQGDLQDKYTIELTYVATLVAYSFRIIMAIVAYFNLEVKAFNIVNAFINALR